jgi:hypothetical protein
MEFCKREKPGVILGHVMFGLTRETLILENFQYGPVEHVKTVYPAADRAGLLFSPSALGVELYFWAHGVGDLPINAIMDPSQQLQSDVRVPLLPGIRSTKLPDRAIVRDSHA